MLTTLTIIFINCAVYTEQIDVDFQPRIYKCCFARVELVKVPCLEAVKEIADYNEVPVDSRQNNSANSTQAVWCREYG